MKRLSVVQHTSAEYLGAMEDHLEARRIRFQYFRPFTEGTPLPHPDAIGDGLVLLGGGPWGTAGERNLPSLEAELDLATTCIMQEKPIIAVGLGAQILAMAAGGGSEPAPLEFTVGTATRAEDDALNGFLPEHYPLAVYMRDRPVPPAYAKTLAVDEAGCASLFQIGKNAFGFTGHPGIKPAIIEDLVMEFEESPEDTGEGLEALRATKAEIDDALVQIMTGLVQLTGLMQD